jgi:hypothetical protein
MFVVRARGNRHSVFRRLRGTSQQKIRYDRARKLKGLTRGRLALLPVNPGQALTRLEGTPDSYQYTDVPL